MSLTPKPYLQPNRTAMHAPKYRSCICVSEDRAWEHKANHLSNSHEAIVNAESIDRNTNNRTQRNSDGGDNQAHECDDKCSELLALHGGLADGEDEIRKGGDCGLVSECLGIWYEVGGSGCS